MKGAADMSANMELAQRCVLTWFTLTPEMAQEWFTEDAVFESRSDQGIAVKGPDEIYTLLDAYRNMCERFETRLLNIAENGDVVLLERDELTYLKNGGCVTVPVMTSILMRDGKVAVWREYWDLAILMNRLRSGEMASQTDEAYQRYEEEASQRGAPVERLKY
jgi:limonene-1,2-epoxide hydrolase